ncbi:probable palmitoyltransferase ZDHHC12 isoform X1 [Rousettus aegyptiacus]|uniref:probable palmitoyltransferase ZDHHC12 isoform X1 n=1 Tax=Rousettus aegyptiacus TaxID=9407 RepID=UPI00168D9170|nr:probable palmitoyltransferase ZDHHC12 isoform X1 [Rousettus aegyptiacus]
MAPWALLNPGVLVRTGHTVLTWGITLVLFLHDTALRQWEEQGELLLPLTFLLLVLGSLLLYLAVSLMDPGYVNIQPQPQEEAKEEQTAMVPPAIPLRRCGYCMVLVGDAGTSWEGSGQAAPAGPPLPRVSSLRPPLRPPLPLDGELCGGAQPPPLRGLPGATAAGASVGPVPGMVRPPVLPALGAVATVQRAPVRHLPAALPLLDGGQPAPGLTPLPGGQQHHHLGVHLLAPHRLPPPAPWQPLRPRPDSQPGPLLLRLALGVLGDPLGRGGRGREQRPGRLGAQEAQPPSPA